MNYLGHGHELHSIETERETEAGSSHLGGPCCQSLHSIFTICPHSTDNFVLLSLLLFRWMAMTCLTYICFFASANPGSIQYFFPGRKNNSHDSDPSSMGSAVAHQHPQRSQLPEPRTSRQKCLQTPFCNHRR